MKNPFTKTLSALLVTILMCVQALTAFATPVTETDLEQLGGTLLVSTLDATGANLNPEAVAYGTVETVPVTGQPFDTAKRFTTTTEPAAPYLMQYVIPIGSAIEKDDVMLATFYARTVSSTLESAEGNIALIMEKTGTWEKSVSETMLIPNQWKKMMVPIKASIAMAVNQSQVTLRFGYKPQVMEIADLKVVNYKKTVAFTDLPSTPITYDGMEDDAPWRAEANARIEQIRKGDLEIQVKDHQGNAVQGANIQVKMTKHDFKFGTAVNSARIFGTDADSVKYRQYLQENFNSAVMEYEMKWDKWESDRARAINLYNWLGERGFAVRGHALLWDGSTRLPTDIGSILNNPEQIKKRIEDHIHEEAGFFKGRVYDWDVLNEPVLNKMIRSVYGDAIMADWFKWAKEADPKAKLYLNETQILGVDAPVIDNLSNILQTIKDNGGPIDGVGIQAHFGGNPTSPIGFYNQLTHFAQYANEVAITEYDMNSARQDIQGKFTRDILLASFSHPNVDSFTLWGFWDKEHWLGNSAMYNADWTLKPAGEQWKKLIFDTWWTNVSGVTGDDGSYKTRGFYGDYDIIVDYGGHQQTVKASLQKGHENKVEIVLGQEQVLVPKTFIPMTVPSQTAEITAPVWPYGSVFRASERTPTSVTLSWPAARDNQEVDSYKIYQNGTLLTSTPGNVTSYDATGLVQGQTYTYVISAVDKVGNESVPSEEIHVSPSDESDVTLPGWTKGSFVQVSNLTTDSASLSWPLATDNDGVTGYRIYVNGKIAGDSTVRSYDLTGLADHSLYTVRVEAKDAEGNLSRGGPVVTFRTLGTADITPPTWPSSSLLQVTETTANSVKLEWNAAQDTRGVTAYRVLRGNEEVVTLPATSNSFRVEGLSQNTSYTFKVEASDRSNNWSVTGPAATIKTLITSDSSAPTWPTGRMLTYSALTDKTVTINWTPAQDNLGVTGYRVYKNNTALADVYGTVQSLSVTGLAAGQPYTFRVEARDAIGNWSILGPTVNLTTISGVVNTQTVLYPSDDAFVQAPAIAGGAGTNFNTGVMRIKGDPLNLNTNRKAFLKFPLSTLTGIVTNATLSLYVYAIEAPNVDINMSLYPVSDSYSTGGPWTETGIYWNNKPDDSSAVKIGSTNLKNATLGTLKKFTVTDQVAAELNGDKVISFELKDDLLGNRFMELFSKDTSVADAIYRPSLTVNIDQLPVTTSIPSWTNGTLNMGQLEPKSVRLTWSSAQDLLGINRYTIFQNGSAIATVGSDVYSYEVTGLTPSTSYTFKVEASNSGLESTSGPSINLTTQAVDSVAPVWSPSAVLTSQDMTRFGVTLTWPAAVDQYRIAAYDIYNGNTVVGSVYGDVLSYRVSGLTAGTAFDFHVSARDGSGNSAVGPAIHVTSLAPDTILPIWSPGSQLTISDISPFGLKLNWPATASTDDSGIHHFRVEQNGSEIVSVAPYVGSYYINGLNSDTSYPFSVIAVDEAGNSSQPLQQTVTTLKADTITPQWPTGSRIVVTPLSDRTYLQWDAAEDNIGIQQYVVYRNGVPVAQVEGSLTTYTIMGVPDATAIYKVEAQDFVGNATVFGPSSNDPEISVPSDITPPGWPAGSSLTQGTVTTNSVQLSWSEAIDRMGVTQYKIYQDGSLFATTTGTSKLVTGLTADTAYTFKVEAGDLAGNWSSNGPSISVRTLTTPPLVVEPPVLEPPATKQPDPKQPVIDVRNGETVITISSQGITTNNGKVSAVLDTETLARAFKKAEEQVAREGRVSIKLPEVAGAKRFALEIPTSFVTSKDANHSLEVSTQLGTLILPSNLLADYPEASQHESLSVQITLDKMPEQANVQGKTRIVVDLQFTAAGQPLKFQSNVTFVQVSIPYALSSEEKSHPDLLNVWYVNEKGEVQLVPSGHYDLTTGSIQFRTNHFSMYAVSYGNPLFEDISTTPWAQKSIEALAAKGIIQGISDRTFNPTASISRADFTKLLVETFGLQAAFETRFDDVQKDAYYAQAIGIASKMGIVNGLDDRHFNPQDAITRQDMFVMIARAMAQVNKSLPTVYSASTSPFEDGADIASYAVEAISALAHKGLIEGNSGKVNPLGNTTRAETSVMLYRLFQYLYQ